MLSRLRGPSLSLQLIPHLSTRVYSLKKRSLVAQLLRGNGSPTPTKSTQKGEGFLDPHHNGDKDTHLLQQREASLSSASSHPPLGLPAELPGLENGRQVDKRFVEDDAYSDQIAKVSVKSKVQRSDGSASLSVLLPTEGSKADPSEGVTALPVLSRLSVPPRIKGRKAHRSVVDTQPCVRAQAGRKRGQITDCGGKPFQTERRKVDPAEVYVQPQEEGNHSHIETKAGVKILALQNQGASQKPCQLGISPLNTGFLKEISVFAPEVGAERITEKISSSENDEMDDGQNAVRHNLYKLKSAVAREKKKKLKVERFVEVYSEMIREEVTDHFLNDWQDMSVKTDKFFSDVQQKVKLVSIESVPLIHVKALLPNREFLSASPKKLMDVLTTLKLFFESGDKAFGIITSNTKILVRPLEQLQHRLKVLVEFEVDKATCYRVAISSMILSAEKHRRLLSFLKDLGLNAESRNRMLYKCPLMMNFSVENRMQMIVDFFDSIEIARPTILKLVELSPKTLFGSHPKNLRVMHKLFQHVGLSSTELIEALGRLRPYSYTDTFLQYNLFREQGLSDQAFVSMIKRSPRFLVRSINDLEAKLHFLLHKAKRDISEVVVFPEYFNYSLKKRIIPRFKLLEELNLQRRLSLSQIIRSEKFGLLTV